MQSADLPPNSDDPAEPLLLEDQHCAPPPESRRDFERGMAYLPGLTVLLIVTNVLVFLWQIATGSLDSAEDLVRSGALVSDRVLAGEYWRLITSMFLHGGVEHLLGNLAVLYILGMAIQHAFGLSRAGAIYLISGMAGGLLSMAFEPRPTVGASGAIFGLAGCLIVMFYRHRRHMFLRDQRIGFVIGAWAAWQIFLGAFNPEVANWAHLGGLLGGMLMGASVLPAAMLKPADHAAEVPDAG